MGLSTFVVRLWALVKAEPPQLGPPQYPKLELRTIDVMSTIVVEIPIRKYARNSGFGFGSGVSDVYLDNVHSVQLLEQAQR